MAARSRQGGQRAGLVLLRAPPLDGTDADAKEAGRLDLWQPSVNGSQQSLAEVGRILLHSASIATDQLLRNPL